LLPPPPSPPFGRSHRLGLPMVVCVKCLLADTPWDVVSVTRRSSGVAPRACVRVYARVLVPPNLYIHTYILAAAARAAWIEKGTERVNPEILGKTQVTALLAK